MHLAVAVACLSVGFSPLPQEQPKPLIEFNVAADGPAPMDAFWMAFTPDGKHLAILVRKPATDEDGLLVVHELATRKIVASVELPRAFQFNSPNFNTGNAISLRGDMVTYEKGGELQELAIPPHRLPANPKKPVLRAGGHLMRLWLDPNPKEDSVAFVGVHDKTEFRVERWDYAASAKHVMLKVSTQGERFRSVTANLSAGRFAIAYGAGWDVTDTASIESWTLGEKPSKVTIDVGKVDTSSLAYSPDGKVIAAGFFDGAVRWYDTSTGKVIKGLSAGRGTVVSLAFHPSGKYLACGTFDKNGRPNLILLNVVTGEVLARVVAYPTGVANLCFNSDGSRLATFGGKGEVRIWNATSLLKLERD